MEKVQAIAGVEPHGDALIQAGFEPVGTFVLFLRRFAFIKAECAGYASSRHQFPLLASEAPPQSFEYFSH